MGDDCSCQTGRSAEAARRAPPLPRFVEGAFARAATRVAYAQARRAAMVGPFDEAFPVPEYPPADWFAGPPSWVSAYRADQGLGPDVETGPGGEPIYKLTVTDDGRVGGWFFEHGQCLVHMPDACPGPSPTGYAAFHQGDVVTADGSMVRVGVIGNTHGHASPWVNWRDAQKHYADPSAQMIVCRAGDDDRGGWISGAVIAGATYGDVALLRRCALSGDWRPDFSRAWFESNGATAAAVLASQGYDCVGPTLVTRPGLPLTGDRGGIRTAGVVIAASLAPIDSAFSGPERATVSSVVDRPIETAEGARLAGVVIQEASMSRTQVRLPDGTEIVSDSGSAGSGPVVAAAVVGATDLPIADRDTAWDPAGAEGRVRILASSDGSGDPATIDWSSYARGFLERDDTADPESFGAYKLGFADVINGQLQAVPAGIAAVAGALQGATGSADVLAADVDGVKTRLGGYYDRMREKFADASITAPWAGAPRAGRAGRAARAAGRVLRAADPTAPPTAPPPATDTAPPATDTPPEDDPAEEAAETWIVPTGPDAPSIVQLQEEADEIESEVDDHEQRLAAVEEFLSAILESDMTAALAADVELPAVVEVEPEVSPT